MEGMDFKRAWMRWWRLERGMNRRWRPNRLWGFLRVLLQDSLQLRGFGMGYEKVTWAVTVRGLLEMTVGWLVFSRQICVFFRQGEFRGKLRKLAQLRLAGGRWGIQGGCMQAVTERLRSFLQYVAVKLIDEPGKAQLKVAELGPKRLRFKLVLAQADVAMLIGRNGFTASAIRSILKAAADKEGVQIQLQIHSHEEEAELQARGEGH
jgi:predicted RNA-binding protein YlqC (UPF0109 family)